MSAGPLAAAVAHLGHAVRPPDPRPDAALVAAFAQDRCEAAAAELVRRHGPTVYGVCRRIHPADADDAFQAVWLVFSRKAGRVRPPGMVGAWLHGVAVKVATKARTQSFTRRRRLMAAAKPDHTTDPTPPDPALAAVLDEEIARLPEKLRRAVVLCDLGGKTRREAALELGWPEGTVATRLAAGRERLARRLTRRGVTLPAAGLAAALAPQATAAPVPLATAVAAVRLMTGTAAVSPAALHLADTAGATMTPATWKLAALGVLAAVGLTVGGVGLAPRADPAKPPDPAARADAVADAPAGEWLLKQVLKDHGQMVYDAAFAPDGRTFVTAGADGTVIVWDTATLGVRWRKQVVKNLPPPGPDITQPFDPKALETPGPVGNPRKPGSNPPAVGVRFDKGGSVVVWHFGTDGVTNEAWLDATDGRRQTVITGADLAPLALGGDKGVFRTGRDHVVRAVLPDGKPAVRLDVPTPDPNGNGFAAVLGSAVSPDGKLVALSEWYGEGGSKLRVCDAATGKTVAERPLGGADASVFTQLAFAPAGDRLACGSTGGQLAVFAAPGWAEAYRAEEPLAKWTDAITFTPDGKQLLVSGYREVHQYGWFGLRMTSNTVHREVWVRDAATGALVQSLPTRTPTPVTKSNIGSVAGFGLDVSRLAVSPDGKTLVATLGSPFRGEAVQPAAEQAAKAAAGEVRVYVRGAVKPPAPPKAEPKPKPDDGPERNQDLWVWQPRVVKEEEGGKQPRAVAFTPDGKVLVTGGVKRAVQFWTMSTDPLRSNVLSLHPSPADDAPTAVAVAPNGKTVAYTRPNGVTVQDADPGCWQLGPPRGSPAAPGTTAVPPDAITPPGERVFETFQTPDHPPTAVAFSPDGKRVAFTDGRRLTVREIGRPGEVGFGPVAGSTPGPAAVSWAPDGKRLVFLPNSKIDPAWPGSGAKTPDPAKATHFLAQVWGAGSGEPMALLTHGTARLTGAVWAGDGKRIVTADEAGEIVIWDGVTFKERKRLTAAGPVTALAVRADGQRFAAGVAKPGGETDVRVQVWTAQEGSDPDNWLGSSTLPLPAAAAVRGLAFSPDGKALAAGTDAGLAVWDRVKAYPK